MFCFSVLRSSSDGAVSRCLSLSRQLLVTSALLLAPHAAQASLIVDITEGAGVVNVEVSGTVDVAGLTFHSTTGSFSSGQARFSPTIGFVAGENPAAMGMDLYAAPGLNWLTPTSYGTGGQTGPSILSFAGDNFMVFPFSPVPWQLGVPVGFTSGVLSTQYSVAGDFASNNIDFANGTLVFELGNTAGDTVTIRNGAPAAAVPEPTPLALALMGLVAAGWRRHRRG